MQGDRALTQDSGVEQHGEAALPAPADTTQKGWHGTRHNEGKVSHGRSYTGELSKLETEAPKEAAGGSQLGTARCTVFLL